MIEFFLGDGAKVKQAFQILDGFCDLVHVIGGIGLDRGSGFRLRLCIAKLVDCFFQTLHNRQFIMNYKNNIPAVYTQICFFWVGIVVHICDVVWGDFIKRVVPVVILGKKNSTIADSQYSTLP